MIKLKDKIEQNRSDFDSLEPPEGHFERFSYRLERSLPVKGGFYIPNYLKIAAILVLVTFSSIVMYQLIRPANYNNSEYTFGILSNEYKEAENYFKQVLDSKYTELKQFDMADQTQKEDIINELKDMDNSYEKLSEEFRQDPNNQRIIDAMIMHYQMKIDVMNNILGQLEEINNTTSNNKNHENTKS